MDYQNNSLEAKDIEIIIKEVALIKLDNGLDATDYLKEGIFKLLADAGTFIFYPFEEEDFWGIYIYKNERHFFIINSSIELEKQIFAAAHELAHTLEIARVAYEYVTPDLMVEYTNHCRYGAKIKMADIIANRFAAELLVGKKALKERWDDLSNRYNLCVKSVILSGEFLVPYRTIVKRLVETGIVTSDDKMNKLLDIQETEIKQIADRYECCNRNYDISKTKHLGGYINKALTMYENNLSTYDDLCKKLALIGKTPEDFDIQYYDLDLSEFILRASEEPETEYGENG